MGILVKDIQVTRDGIELVDCYVGIYKGHVLIRKEIPGKFHVECEFGVWANENARHSGFKPMRKIGEVVEFEDRLPPVSEIYNALYDKLKIVWFKNYEDRLVNHEIVIPDTSNVA